MNFWNDPLKVAADWLLGIFTGWGMPEIAAQILIGFIGILLLITILMVLDIFLVWIERKVVSRFQDRIGPNRVGPFGLIQPFADIIKLLIKEDITPGGADKVVYNLAPMLSMMSVLVLWAVVPIAPKMLGVDLNIGALYIIAVGAIGTLSIIMAVTYDLQGYQLLLDSLIQWETTRSMYDYRFSGSISQIKILSILTGSEYGMAMSHYLEGIRRGLGDPLLAETEFLTALNYFKEKQDTSGYLHTTMHLFSVSLNSTMVNVGKIERHKNLYTEVLSLENHLKNPLDKIILLRIKILYDFYMTGPTSVSYHQKSITESLQLVEKLDDKYNYYKFLILNAIAIMHSLHVANAESERYHLLSYAFIEKKVCLIVKQY